jgi:hypothetical protein
MYPAFALMAGAAADGWFTNGEWSRGKLLSLILFGVVALIFAGLATPWALSAIRADAAADFGPHLADRVAYEWTAAWDASGIGLWVTLLIVFTAGATIYLVIRKNAMGLLAGIVACSVVAGVGYRAAVLPNQSWMLSTEASLSALRELCALPEGTARWEKSGCAQQAINGRAFIPPKAVHAIAFAEPSLVFELGNKITLPPVSKAEIPSVAEDNRPAWLINIGEPEGREALDQLVKAAAAADRCIRFARRHAFNYSNGVARARPGQGQGQSDALPEQPASDRHRVPALHRRQSGLVSRPMGLGRGRRQERDLQARRWGGPLLRRFHRPDQPAAQPLCHDG